MDRDYHPKTNNAVILKWDNIYKYCMIVINWMWNVTLDMFNIMYVVTKFSKYNTKPQKEHYKQLYLIISHLNYYKKSRGGI